MQINNKPELKKFRKQLRNNSTSAEAVLWIQLKNSQLENKKFRRQHSIGFCILDFYCPSEKLAIELDGAGHYTEEGIKKDKNRTLYLNMIGIRVIRFENKLIFQNMPQVLPEIKNHFTQNIPPPRGGTDL